MLRMRPGHSVAEARAILAARARVRRNPFADRDPQEGSRRALVRALSGAVALLLLVFACTPPLPRPEARVTRGEAIYNATCIACHGGPTGGSMMDYPPRHNASGHTWHHPDCELKTVIKDGGNAMTEQMRRMMAPPGAPTMPVFRDRLSDEEIDAVLAFIKTMWTEDERRFQEQITREQC